VRCRLGFVGQLQLEPDPLARPKRPLVVSPVELQLEITFDRGTPVRPFLFSTGVSGQTRQHHSYTDQQWMVHTP
jgi:hypothetical protein